MSSLLVRHVPGDAIRMAKKLAEQNHHSLQEEISSMLIEAIRFRAGAWSQDADKVRKRLLGRNGSHSDSAKLLRADRAR